MPRRKRPPRTQRSEHWIRVAVNECSHALNTQVSNLFGWNKGDQITWVSPIASDGYAEYFDQAFLDRLGVRDVKVPLYDFWPHSGPRWDGLARTESGKLLLVEAKAYIEEAVDYGSAAGSTSLGKIKTALSDAKSCFGASDDATWESPFYQYANRLAHLYYLRQLNKLDAYLLFLYFADAPDVPKPCSAEKWQGAERLIKKALGLGAHRFQECVCTLIWSVPEMRSPSAPRLLS